MYLTTRNCWRVAMTENEAIIRFDFIRCALLGGTKPHIMPNEENIGLVDAAIQALEEVQQYRVIGTPEECRKSVEICKAMIERNITPDDMENYMKFEDECIKQGFTLVGLLKAGKKHEAMEPIRMDKCTCPSCGTHNEVWKKRRNILPSDIVYCWHCGQAVEIKRSDK